MAKKFEEIIVGYKIISEQFDLQFLLTSKFDDYGEIMHDYVIEKIKTECCEILKDIKLEDNPPPRKDELWKIYLNYLLEKTDVKVDFGPKAEEITNFQMKIKTKDEEIPSDLVKIEKPLKLRNEEPSMIVVATLLDKIPNFANLTRTCEVFGVTQLVVPSIKILEDEAFKTISVTAEKWLPMIEVKEKDLMEYLKFKKLSGYTLIGLEQTRNSKSIEKFKFPDKCILLLGNESLGTPVEYIQVMDEFIEIPQFGQIRSLNVHISAVICIWECIKQKKIPN